MKAQARRRVASASALLLTVGLLAAGTASDPAAASSCRATPAILSGTPTAYDLPGGASVRIWQTSTVRVAAVLIPKATLTPTVATAPTLARAVTPQAMVTKDPAAVVVINGGHFNPSVPGIPEKSQMRASVLRKGVLSTDNNLAVYADKSVWLTHSAMSGAVRSVHGGLRLAALNWQSLPSSGVSAFTWAWGNRTHAYGPRTVVVTDGVVTAVRVGRAGAGRPGSHQQFLTAPSGRFATALAKLRVGTRVTVTARPTGVREYDGFWPHTPVGTPTGVLGAGTTLVRAGANNTTCGARDENLRPRSGIGWKANGDMVVVAVSGRGGGASVHQFSDFMRRLGAVTAVNLDGGTSTTLLVRRTVGGPLVRLDRSIASYQRPVVDALSFRAT